MDGQGAICRLTKRYYGGVYSPLLKEKDARVSMHRALKLKISTAFKTRKIWWQNQNLRLVRRGAAMY